MKLPRSVSGADLVKGLTKLGYSVTRQKGSHIRMTTKQGGEHHVTVPNHPSVRVGTLAGILADVADHLGRQCEKPGPCEPGLFFQAVSFRLLPACAKRALALLLTTDH